MATIQPPRQIPQPGAIAVPQISGQQTDVVFFGEVIEKIGNKKYKITNGGFSACEQPTPRWNLTAGTVVVNVDHYTWLRQAIFNVKGVPLLYVPFLYFPTTEDGRATGFLIPTYGVSTIRGQTIHNAFFWAMSRWQDTTFLYDWFSKTGTGGGAEYRFNRGGGSDGQLNVYRLDERTTQYATPTGTTTVPGQRSFMVNGTANHMFPYGLRSRAYANYFSSITANQTFSTNVTTTTNNNRRYGGNVVGSWGTYSVNGTFDRTEYFQDLTTSNVVGSTPRLSVSRGERPLFSQTSPLYVAVAGEAGHLDRVFKSGPTVDDRSLARGDFFSQLRYPFKKWQWFTVNSTVSWRDTYYSRSLDLTTTKPIDDNLNREFATFSAQSSGPVLVRVWDTPDSGYAERFKHTIEPVFGIQRTTAIDEQPQIIVIDGIDQIYGNTTSINYGLSNRLYAKRKIGTTTQAQQIVTLDIGQTYYSRAVASTVDPRYATTNVLGQSLTPPSNFSPVNVNLRVSPTTSTDSSMRLEFDGRYRRIRNLSATTTYYWTSRIQAAASWSKKFFIHELGGWNDPRFLDHALNMSANAHTFDNRYGANYSLNYDVLRSRFVQQRMSAFYNAQCCGLAFEYQQYNLSGLTIIGLPSDRRFFLSFTLAGLGNFSPFNGGLGAVPR
jgi:LPS-assembly protein